MNSYTLNKILIDFFPELSEEYQNEISWQEGEWTGSHVVFGDVFAPYLMLCIKNDDINNLNKIFGFIEFLLQKNDMYINEVIAFSVFEGNTVEIIDSLHMKNTIERKSCELLAEVVNRNTQLK